MDKWISVDDRLPEIGVDVLLLIDGDGVIQGNRDDAKCRDWNFITLDMHGCGCCAGDSDIVTHWQPLPEPPKS